jgi:transcriptional regulator with XRE-family HTH domain
MSRKKALYVYFSGLPGRIRKIRGEITQKEFAVLMGVSQGTINKYETGIASPGVVVLKKIADHGKVTVEWLLHGEDRQAAQFLEDVQKTYDTRLAVLDVEALARAIFLARQFIKKERQRLSDAGVAQLTAYLYEYIDSEKEDPGEVVIRRLADLIYKQEKDS